LLQDISIPAISSANFAVNLTLAILMVHARATRSVYPGFGDWMASHVALAAGMVLLSAKAFLPPWIALLLGNGLIMLSQVLVYSGFIRFFGLSHQGSFVAIRWCV